MLIKQTYRLYFASLVLCLGSLAMPLFAQDTRVQFDVAPSTEAFQVRTANRPPIDIESEGDSLPRLTKLVTMRFEISSFVRDHDSEEPLEYIYTIESPSLQFRVVDYLPKTSMESRYAGNISYEEQRDRRIGVHADATGYYKYVTGAYATGSFDDSKQSRVRYELLPPMELIAASGTIQRGSGVYFKLRSTPRETLEGAREFWVTAQVPANWRGDILRIRCEARGYDRRLLGDDEHPSVGRGEFLVAAHLEGDGEAYEAAGQLVDAERALRRTVAARQREIDRQSMPSLVYRAGFKAPKIPESWLRDAMFAQARVEVTDRLPTDVQNALATYTRQRSRLHGLNGTAAPSRYSNQARERSVESIR
jgi:hypothetical protein